MFTGIIETMGTVVNIESTGTNKTFIIESSLSQHLHVDQSISHNGVCLTIEQVNGMQHQVTAIAETLNKTTLGTWKVGYKINLERSMLASSRIDGHFVQGHVDTIGLCKNIINKGGSWEYEIEFPESFTKLVIEKGSISLNGTSLTIFNVTRTNFTVAIIPFTYEHTCIHMLQPGDQVNLEFDILGKYILRSQL